MSWYPVFFYTLSFSAACLFAYGAHRVIKDIQQVPIAEEGWFGGRADSSIGGNPLFRVMMFVVRLLARINVTWDLGAYEIMIKKKLDAELPRNEITPTLIVKDSAKAKTDDGTA